MSTYKSNIQEFLTIYNGSTGADGTTYYLHIAYSNSEDGTTDFSLTDSADKTYIGQCVNTDSDAPTDPSVYKWQYVKGAQGEQGEQGEQGDDGTISSDTAPEDTTKLWLDTSSDPAVLKIYVDYSYTNDSGVTVEIVGWYTVNDQSSEINDVNTRVDSLSSTVSSVSQTASSLQESVEEVTETTNTLSGNVTNLLNQLGDSGDLSDTNLAGNTVYQALVAVSNALQTSNDNWDLTFNSIVQTIYSNSSDISTLNDTTTSLQSVVSHIVLGVDSSGEPYISLSTSDSDFSLNITNDRISFMDSDTEVAYISDNKMVIHSAEIDDITVNTTLNLFDNFQFININGYLALVKGSD